MAVTWPFPPVYRVITQVALWGVGLPIALIAWARATSDVVRIPPVYSPWLGLALSLAGAALLLAGVAQRWHPGGTRNVAQGVSRLFPHPVYTGFCIVCPGVSIALGSASGLWLVSPLVALSCVALVLGNARHHSGEGQLLPEAGTGPPTGSDRLRFYLFVLLPWLVLYEIVLAIGMPPDAISGVSRLEQRLPVLEWSQIVYASTYILTVIAPLFAKTRNDLRSYSVRGLWTMLLAYPAFLLIPLIAPKRPFTAHTIPGRLLLWERTLDSPVAAFPSFHVIWAMLAADVFARRWPRLRALFYGWAILVAISCVTTSQHSILDVLGGAATVALVVHRHRVWAAFRLQAERFASSRYEWRMGPARIVSQGFYAGVAAFLGLRLAETMAGSWMIVAAFTVAVSLAQAVGRLRRPAPVYSMCWSVAITLILTRLWLLAAPLHLIAGLYFILAGLGRFVEEAWRGEWRPQWTAIAGAIAGVLMTALGHSVPAPKPHFAWTTLPLAVICGVAVALSAALYFPNSKRRLPPPVIESHSFLSE